MSVELDKGLYTPVLRDPTSRLVVQRARLHKADARGGKYYRRAPGSDGNHKYYYTRASYEKDHGHKAHVDGSQALRDRGQRVLRSTLERLRKQKISAGDRRRTVQDVIDKYGLTADDVDSVRADLTPVEKGAVTMDAIDSLGVLAKGLATRLHKAKYISRKPDGKGGWIYKYPSKKTLRNQPVSAKTIAEAREGTKRVGPKKSAEHADRFAQGLADGTVSRSEYTNWTAAHSEAHGKDAPGHSGYEVGQRLRDPKKKPLTKEQAYSKQLDEVRNYASKYLQQGGRSDHLGYALTERFVHEVKSADLDKIAHAAGKDFSTKRGHDLIHDVQHAMFKEGTRAVPGIVHSEGLMSSAKAAQEHLAGHREKYGEFHPGHKELHKQMQSHLAGARVTDNIPKTAHKPRVDKAAEAKKKAAATKAAEAKSKEDKHAARVSEARKQLAAGKDGNKVRSELIAGGMSRDDAFKVVMDAITKKSETSFVSRAQHVDALETLGVLAKSM